MTKFSGNEYADVPGLIEHDGPNAEVVSKCECGFKIDACATNLCHRKKVHLAGLTPGSKWPDGAPVMTVSPAGWKTYTITQEQMNRLHGAAHSGGLLGGDAAYRGCLTIGAILSEIAFKAGFDRSPGSAPEDDDPAPVSRS